MGEKSTVQWSRGEFFFCLHRNMFKRAMSRIETKEEEDDEEYNACLLRNLIL